MLSIGQAARLLGVSIETLRNWDREGKLVPTRTESGQRRYSSELIEEARGKGLITSKDIDYTCYSVTKKIFLKEISDALSSFKDNELLDISFHKHAGYPSSGLIVKTVNKTKYSASSIGSVDDILKLREDDDLVEVGV